MKRFLLAAVLAAGVLAPSAAAAEQLHANVLAWSPNDVRAGKTVSLVLLLYTAGPTANPSDGVPATGVGDVEVVLRGKEITRRFPARNRGDGSYDAQIVFPANGGWDLTVGYGDGAEVPLGKSGICVGAPICVEELSASAPLEDDGRRWLPVALVALLTIGLFLTAAKALHALARLRVEPVAESQRTLLGVRGEVGLRQKATRGTRFDVQP
jgi:hypothetical protein